MATYNPSVLRDDSSVDYVVDGATHTPDFSHQLTEAAIKESSLNSLFALGKMVAGAGLTGVVLLSIGHASVAVFGALCAGITMLYMAGLLDVTRLRDAMVLLVPTAFIWALLMVDHRNILLVGLALFTHVCTTFFAGTSKTSGAIQALGLWPLLFGMSASAALIFGFQYFL